MGIFVKSNHLPNGRHSLHHLVRVILQPVQYRGLAGIVESQNQNSALFGAKHGRKRLDDLGDKQTPVLWCVLCPSTLVYVSSRNSPPTPPTPRPPEDSEAPGCLAYILGLANVHVHTSRTISKAQ